MRTVACDPDEQLALAALEAFDFMDSISSSRPPGGYTAFRNESLGAAHLRPPGSGGAGRPPTDVGDGIFVSGAHRAIGLFRWSEASHTDVSSLILQATVGRKVGGRRNLVACSKL